jgi:nucleoside-diphosphate-sugar epimerase
LVPDDAANGSGRDGVVGRHVVPRLCEHGHEVRAAVCSEAYAQILRDIGIDAVRGAIFDV